MTDPYSELPPEITIPDAEKQALDSSQYTEGAQAIDTQVTQDTAALGLQKSTAQQGYAQQRQDTVNAFQDALDAIHESVRQVGIGVRSGAAQRGLYNASGEYSGIGTNIAGEAVQPYVKQIGKQGERQAQQLGNITVNETHTLQGIDDKINALPNTANQEKMKLKQGIVDSIINLSEKNRKSALDQINTAIDNQLAQDKFNYQGEQDTVNQQTEAQKTAFDQQLALAKFQTEAQKIAAKPRQDQLKNRADLQAKGYKYIATPKEVAKLKKAGVPLVNVGKDWFVVSEADQLKLRQQKATLDKTLKGKGGGEGLIPGTNTKNRLLTFAETIKFNVPVGTKLSDVMGKTIQTDQTTTTLDNFVKNLQATKGMNLDPQQIGTVYNNYLEAQQAIDQDPSVFQKIKEDPNAQIFKHLLKLKKLDSSSSDDTLF